MNTTFQDVRLLRYDERPSLLVMAEQPAEEGRIAPAWQNRAAGRALRLARASMEGGPSKQAAFVARLGRELGISLSVGAYSNYENGRRTVPAAVLIEAARIAGRSMDDLLSEAGRPEITEWASGLGMSQRIAEIERTLGQLQDGLRSQRVHTSGSASPRIERQLERQGELLAKVVTALHEADLWESGKDAEVTRTKRAEGRGSG